MHHRLSSHTSDDELVAAGGSTRFYETLRKQSVSAELHVFAHGAHGTGLGGGDASLSLWPQLLQEWMRHRGLLPGL